MTVGIGLMCKAPRVGLSKTRLAVTVGAERASVLAAAFLTDAVATLQHAARVSPFRFYAFFAPADAGNELRAFFPDTIPMYQQDDRSLGDAMYSALRVMLAEHSDGAAVIGSDLPTLPPGCLVQAAACLRAMNEGVVIGPSDDGGYYLIGVKSERAAPLFAPMAWSTPHVLAETRARAAAHGLAVVELPMWYDVDDAPSLARLAHDLRSGCVPAETARATRRALGF